MLRGQAKFNVDRISLIDVITDPNSVLPFSFAATVLLFRVVGPLCMVGTFFAQKRHLGSIRKNTFFLPVFTSRDPETDYRYTEHQSDDLYSSQGFVSGLRYELRKQNFKARAKPDAGYFFSLLGLGRIQLNSQI